MSEVHITFARIIQFSLIQHQSMIPNGTSVKLASENDITAWRKRVLVVTLDLQTKSFY